LIGHFRGGLAMAAVSGCAAFGTVSGSSLATAAMMGQGRAAGIAALQYLPGFATGALAAGGTLGIPIPPSIVLIIYAIIIEGNIVDLFQAGFLPGLLATAGYMAAIAIVVRIDPAAGPAACRLRRALEPAQADLDRRRHLSDRHGPRRPKAPASARWGPSWSRSPTAACACKASLTP
jgi:TRAP-type C4-dicarboxylate transport system permease large subunit